MAIFSFHCSSTERTDNSPKLASKVSFKNYTVYKMTDMTARLVHFVEGTDNDKTAIDLKGLFSLEEYKKNVPVKIQKRLSEIYKKDKSSLIFNEYFIPVKYKFTSQWTDKKKRVHISNYKKNHSTSDLTPYLGPLSKIPTSWWGLATYEIKLKNENIRIKSFAAKDIWTISTAYWGYIEVYVSKELSDIPGSPVYILQAGDPNNYYKDSGTYLVYPESQ